MHTVHRNTGPARALRDAWATTAASVALLIVRDGRDVRAVTITSLLSVSFEPPVALLTLHRESSMVARLESAQRFGVSVLAEDQQHVAQQLALPQRPPLDPGLLVPGRPLLAGAAAHFLLRLRQRQCVGDHHVVLADIEEASAEHRRPLVYQMRDYRLLGTRAGFSVRG